MKKELDEALVRDFPNLYRDRYGNKLDTCMCWGFPGDGWEPLIRRLSEQLEKLISDLPPEERKFCCASQCKEKFGTLRFYMTSSTKEMEALIEAAEAESEITCEKCGALGEVKVEEDKGRAVCDACSEKKTTVELPPP